MNEYSYQMNDAFSKIRLILQLLDLIFIFQNILHYKIFMKTLYTFKKIYKDLFVFQCTSFLK